MPKTYIITITVTIITTLTCEQSPKTSKQISPNTHTHTHKNQHKIYFLIKIISNASFSFYSFLFFLTHELVSSLQIQLLYHLLLWSVWIEREGGGVK